MSNAKTVGPSFRPLNARRQTFHEITPEQYAASRRTRDTAMPSTPSTIGEAHAQTHTLEKIVAAMSDVAQRLTNLELKKQAALRQQQQQPPVILQPNPQRATDAASPCACKQPTLVPQRTFDGVKTMRNANLAPLSHVIFNARPRATRDQNQQFGERPSRFSSEENTRLSYTAPGAAGPPSPAEINAANRAFHAKDNTAQMQGYAAQARQRQAPNNTPYDTPENNSPTGARGANSSRVPPGTESYSNDPSEAFTHQGPHQPGPFQRHEGDISRPSPAALSTLNAAYNKARTSDERDQIEHDWKRYVSGSAHDANSPEARRDMWKPKQPAISVSQAPRREDTHDAPGRETVYGTGYVPGTSLAEGNTTKPGGGGGIHPIASSGGSDPGSNAFNTGPRAMGPVGSYGGAGDLKSSEGAPAGAPGAHNSANVPTPPTKPSDLSESSSGSSSSGETPTPPVKPPSLGGTGESPEGLHPQAEEGGGASPTGSEGTGLAKMVRGWVTGETE
jgi:hypothetical protein